MNQPTSTFKASSSRTFAGTTLLPSLLVVDDEPSVLEMLHDALDLWGFDVFLAKNGREGLDVLAKQKVDGMLVDLDMPVMDGLTMLDEVRWLGYRMPVVMMSGGERGAALRKLVQEGAQGFIRKPFSLSHLRDLCTTVFKTQSLCVPDTDCLPVNHGAKTSVGEH